jgi:hypothetical protein
MLASNTSTRIGQEMEEIMASTRKQPNIVFIPVDKPGWRELGCHGGAVPRAAPRAAPCAAPAPGIDAHAAGALPSWNDGAAAQQGVQA